VLAARYGLHSVTASSLNAVSAEKVVAVSRPTGGNLLYDGRARPGRDTRCRSRAASYGDGGSLRVVVVDPRALTPLPGQLPVAVLGLPVRHV
jgi:hypothetical protein